jgi:serine/threonine-protein kinase
VTGPEPTGGQGDPGRASDDLESGFVDIAHSAASHPVQIGPYQVVGLLGGGSMATLYVANKVCRFGQVHRNVIKRVNRARPDASMLQEMLLDEARAMAYFDHPNLVALQDVGEDEQGAYIALEFVDGTDLKRVNARLRTRREALPFELACFVVAEVLRGLHHAHTANDHDGTHLDIVHRDVNPSNVLISRSGHVKLTDFGVVRMKERVQQKTEPGLVKGKYAYLAPEYIAGGPCSVRTDLYAAGVMLFELLTGRECYTGRSAYEVMWKIVNKGVPLYRLDREGVPEDLRRIVERATAMDPEQRYREAQDMANALEAWMVRNRRHATPWVLSVFFERHHLIPGPQERPPPMIPLANLHDALADSAGSAAEPPSAPSVGPIELGDPGTAAPEPEPLPQPLRPPSTEEPGRSRAFTVSTSQEAASSWSEPTPARDDGLEMRDPHVGELTPMPELDEVPLDPRLPARALTDGGEVAVTPSADDQPTQEVAEVETETDAPAADAEPAEPSAEASPDSETHDEVEVESEDTRDDGIAIELGQPTAEALASALASTADLPPSEQDTQEAVPPNPAPTVEDESDQATADLHEASVPEGVPASGKLEDHPAVDVLEAYSEGQASGVLEFRCGLIWKRVRLDEGNPTGITSNMGMELIGEHLVKARLITREQLDQALEDSERSARSLTQTLLDQGALDKERLAVELGNNLSARLQEVLEWRWGTFEFKDRPVPAADILPRLDLDALLSTARQKREESHAPGREQELSDSLNPHRRLKEALKVARSIADSSGKGRVDRPWRTDSRD